LEELLEGDRVGKDVFDLGQFEALDVEQVLAGL
jgi:hypothetical protein